MYNKVLIKTYDPKRLNALYMIYLIKAKSRNFYCSPETIKYKYCPKFWTCPTDLAYIIYRLEL